MIDKELDKITERAFAIGIEVGVIQTGKELGLIDENISEKQAHAIYGEKQVKEWRRKQWIIGYPSGNKTRSKFYYKRSELETAQRMLDYQNLLPSNKLKQFIENNGTPQVHKKSHNEKSKNHFPIASKFQRH
ncbi:hypothetical protein [Mangrovibacterium sp.]|uniref:hypothetical protein n=1 Tax=Mangrovibacterium sp. TaxID=1961364 RepID=UPI003564E2BA